MEVGAEWAERWLRTAAAVVADHRKELNDLDRAIGDGDHGENLARGFEAIVSRLQDDTQLSVGGYFKLAALTLMSQVGGAAGPLYGTAFLRTATEVGDCRVVGPSQLAQLLAAARDGIVARGKAMVGEKTMVDAWSPAADAAAEAAAAGATVIDVLEAAAAAARRGAESTDALIARKGRASYLAERSAGHRDPGAASTVLLLQAAVDAARQCAPATGQENGQEHGQEHGQQYGQEHGQQYGQEHGQ